MFAMDLLLDPDIPVVSLIGKAGSGKTLCAIAAGLQQTMENDESLYKRLIVSRPVLPLGKDIGYLPGSIQEKMSTPKSQALRCGGLSGAIPPMKAAAAKSHRSNK